MTRDAVELLSQTRPFGRLPARLLEETASKMSLMTFAGGTVLAVQGATTLDHVYFIRSGSLELFFESEGEKTLRGVLGPGNLFGAMSILMNAGLAIRSLTVVHAASAYLLPKKAFVDLCGSHRFVRDHFQALFDQRMRDESYAAAIAASQVIYVLSQIPPNISPSPITLARVFPWASSK